MTLSVNIDFKLAMFCPTCSASTASSHGVKLAFLALLCFTSSKVSRDISFLKHARNIRPMVSLKSLCSGIVEPHFRYCCSEKGCCGTTDINQLQKLQNRAARIVTNSRFDFPSRPLIGSLGRKTIHELVNEEWSTSLSMGLLHSTCAIFSLATVLVTLVAFEIRQWT